MKIRKILAVLLSAVMMISTFSFTVFADGANNFDLKAVDEDGNVITSVKPGESFYILIPSNPEIEFGSMSIGYRPNGTHGLIFDISSFSCNSETDCTMPGSGVCSIFNDVDTATASVLLNQIPFSMAPLKSDYMAKIKFTVKDTAELGAKEFSVVNVEVYNDDGVDLGFSYNPVSITVDRLENPSNLAIDADTATASWDAVTDATSYDYVIYCGGEPVKSGNTTETSVDFASKVSATGDYTFSVTAKSSDKTSNTVTLDDPVHIVYVPIVIKEKNVEYIKTSGGLEIILDLEGENALESIEKDGTALTADTDYTVEGNKVTINESVLTEDTQLTFKFTQSAAEKVDISVVEGKFIITTDKDTYSPEEDITVTVTYEGTGKLYGYDYKLSYDGNVVEPAAETVIEHEIDYTSDPENPLTCSKNYIFKAKTLTTPDNAAKFSIENGHMTLNDALSNALTFASEKTVNILGTYPEGAVVVTANPAVDYDGNAHKSASVINTLGAAITYTCNGTDYNEIPEFTDAGVYTVTYTTSADGYIGSTGQFEFTINAIDFPYTTIDTNPVVYSGIPQGSEPTDDYKTTTTGDNSVTYYYIDAGNADPEKDYSDMTAAELEQAGFSTTMPAHTDAGEYDLIYVAVAPNHNNGQGTTKLTITQKALTITVDSKEKWVGDANPEFTSVITGWVNSENFSNNVTVAYEGIKDADNHENEDLSVGVYDIKVDFANTSLDPAVTNYKLDSTLIVNSSLTVKELVEGSEDGFIVEVIKRVDGDENSFDYTEGYALVLVHTDRNATFKFEDNLMINTSTKAARYKYDGKTYTNVYGWVVAAGETDTIETIKAKVTYNTTKGLTENLFDLSAADCEVNQVIPQIVDISDLVSAAFSYNNDSANYLETGKTYVMLASDVNSDKKIDSENDFAAIKHKITNVDGE